MTATYDSIATTTLGSASASINFNSISSAYTDLKVVLVANLAAGGVDLCMRLNNNSGVTYSCTYVIGNGSSATSTRNLSDNTYRISINGFTTGAQPLFAEIDIFSYSNATVNKSILAKVAQDTGGGGNIQATVGLCQLTSAVTSVNLFNSGGTNFAAGTTATLYGIKSE